MPVMPNVPTDTTTLVIALGIGVLVGLERGWEQRQALDGSRVAGIRSFALLGLLGGVSGLLGQALGGAVVAMALAAVAALVVSGYLMSVRMQGGQGITTAVAMLVTFALGVAVAVGFQQEAAASAVVMAILLGLKSEIHDWLGRINRQELVAALQLLLLSVVVLPMLPDRGIGDLSSINPHRLWWLVVLVASISFCGHFAVRLLGQRQGTLVTSLLGGLASSTALTVQFARRSRAHPALSGLLAAGIILAGATVPARMVIEVAVVNPELLGLVVAPLALMAVAGVVAGVVLVWRSGETQDQEPLETRPFRLSMVLQFALLLGLISLAGELARRYLGDTGVYALAALSGLADADAITVSLASMAREGLAPAVAGRAVVLVAMAAALSKVLLGVSLGSGVLAGRVAAASLGMVLPGLPWLILI